MRLVLPARAVSYFGDALTLVVLALKIAESDQPVRMTVMLIAFSLPLFALSSVAGRLVDEHDSRRLLVGAGCLQVLASLGLVLSTSFAAMVGCVVLLQVGQAVTGPSWSALVPRIVGDALVGPAVGLQQSLAATAGLAGAAVGGVLYDVLGYAGTLAFDTATFALLVAVAATVRTRRGRRYDLVSTASAGGSGGSGAPAGAHDEPRSGLTLIRRDALLRLLVPALWLFILSAEATNVVEIFLIRGDLGASAAGYGATMAAFMLGSIAGPALAGRVVGDRARVSWTAACAGAMGALTVAIGLSPTIAVALPLFVVVGVCGGALNALVSILIVTRTPERVRGRVLSTVNGTARGFSVLAMVTGGLCGQLVGARSTFVGCGLVSVLAAVVVMRCRSGAGAGAPTGDPVAGTATMGV